MTDPSAIGPTLDLLINRTQSIQIQCYQADGASELVVQAGDTFRFKVWNTDGSAPAIEADSLALLSAAFTAAVSDTLTSAAHGLANGDAVRLTTTGTLPAGLALNTTYYVISAATNTFELSATSGGSAIDIADTGTGTHTFTQTKSSITVDNIGVANTTPATVTVKLDQLQTAGLTADAEYDYELSLVDDDDSDKIKTCVRGKFLTDGSATGPIGLT